MVISQKAAGHFRLREELIRVRDSGRHRGVLDVALIQQVIDYHDRQARK